MAYYGIEYLRRKLTEKRTRVNLRYSYYEQKRNIDYLSRVLPSNYVWMSKALGWCSKAVDSVADRLQFNEFRNDVMGFNNIFDLNNKDVIIDSALLSACVSACSFFYISADENLFPRIQVVDGGNATGVIDPITNMLTEGYAVLERDKNDNPTLEAYFVAGRTDYYPAGEEPYSVQNPALYPLLVPVIYRPDAKRPFGHARITRAAMSIQQGAMETLLYSGVASEFYSFPQKYVLGLDPDAEFNNRAASMSSFLRFDKDSDGEKPSIGQFTQYSMQPYIEMLKAQASMFAGETGLTMDDLGFNTVNPSSAEAIKASHDQLKLTVRKAQKNFGVALINTGYLAASVRDGRPYERTRVYETKCAWDPAFELDLAALSTAGDGLLKVAQAVPDYFTEEKIRDLLGF